MRFVKPVSPGVSTGLVKATYAQVTREFGLGRDLAGNSPFMAHSPDPELLAGFWCVLYETVIAEGRLARADKETIAASVSSINRCPFCVEVHSLLQGVAGGGANDRAALSAGEPAALGGARLRQLAEWARSTRDPAAAILRDPPFSTEEAPEAIGTAVAFHYVNRIVEVFQGPGGVRAGPKALGRVTDPILRLMAGRAIRRRHERGMSLSLLPNGEPLRAPRWTRASPNIAAAFARFGSAVERAGAAALPKAVRSRVSDSVMSWGGEDPGLGHGWIDAVLAETDPGLRGVCRLPLLAALAPYRVTNEDVEEFRGHRHQDRALVAAVAWASFTAAERIGQWLTPKVEAS
jgi:AhpD family alkylhydroperoxidase